MLTKDEIAALLGMTEPERRRLHDDPAFEKALRGTLRVQGAELSASFRALGEAFARTLPSWMRQRR